MDNNKKINEFKKLSNEELSKIIRDINSDETEIIIASVEKGDRDYKEGKIYTTEEVRKKLLSESILVRRSY